MAKAILYARVSTHEQARSGYSLAQQIEALRAYATREGYEVLEEVQDPGQSGASLERPGMDRVRDLVAAGGVSVVLAQDRDRLAREPAHHYLLRREFQEHGCALRSLNDRGDDSPEGELTDGILDQLAKYERAKTTERMRRGKLRKVREGKIIAGRMAKHGRAKYGFRYNESRDALVVDEERMPIVRRMFYMVGVEAKPLYAVKRTLDTEGVLTPTGKRGWAAQIIRRYILSDLYKPHTVEEIKALVSEEAAARLDPHKRYGIWWWGTRKVDRTQVSEAGPDGRRYRYHYRTMQKPKDEWTGVPVPDSGIPREWVDAARVAVESNRRTSNAGRRFWELSGGVLKCAECGKTMTAHTCPRPGGSAYFYYRCTAGAYHKGPESCTAKKHHRAEELEKRVWEAVSGILKHPDRLRVGLDAMIEQENQSMRGDPEGEIAAWLDKLAETDQMRKGYQEQAARGYMNLDELGDALKELDETRALAERELRKLQHRRERIERIEEDKNTLLEHYASVTPEAVDSLSAEERRHVYGMLKLKVSVTPAGFLEASGDAYGFCEMEISSV